MWFYKLTAYHTDPSQDLMLVDRQKLMIQNKLIKMKNIRILQIANEFIAKGDYESFLAYCTADTKWVFVGDRILHGKEEVRAYMKEFYQEPPVFNVEKSIEEGDSVMVTGEIRLRNKAGKYEHFDYCDIWRFEDGKMAELKAFVIEKNGSLLPSSE